MVALLTSKCLPVCCFVLPLGRSSSIILCLTSVRPCVYIYRYVCFCFVCFALWCVFRMVDARLCVGSFVPVCFFYVCCFFLSCLASWILRIAGCKFCTIMLYRVSCVCASVCLFAR